MADGETNTLEYWLNWKFLLCAIWIFGVAIASIFLIRKYEGRKKSDSEESEKDRKRVGVLYEDEAWNTCFRGLHPGWLLAFRLLALSYLLMIIIADGFSTGVGVFFFYTEWTFSLVTTYFLLGSMLSIYGLWECRNRIGDVDDDDMTVDAEKGNCEPPSLERAAEKSNMSKSFSNINDLQTRRIANAWGYMFQILFQMSGGAVVLTDLVFWVVLFPFVQSNDHDIKFLIINLHTINVVFLLGDSAMNHMRFPMFRIAYFILWTVTFVVFQWISHSIESIWWPYPFLNLEPPTAPLWYFAIGLMHIPCFGIFAGLVKLKQFGFSRLFPNSYRSLT